MTGLGGNILTLPEEDLTTTSSLIPDKMTYGSSSFEDVTQSYSNASYVCVRPKQEPGVILPGQYRDETVKYYPVFDKVRTLSQSPLSVRPVLFQVEVEELEKPEQIATTSTFWETTSKEETDENDENLENNRGVLAIKHDPKVIFSEEIEIETSKLPRWKPRITIDRRMIETEDE